MKISNDFPNVSVARQIDHQGISIFYITKNLLSITLKISTLVAVEKCVTI